MTKFSSLFVLLVSGSMQLPAQAPPQMRLPVNDSVKAAALPEVLLTFDAVLNNKRVELSWASDHEQDHNYFTIEKSKDALTFETLTTIRNFGNESHLVNYFDVDFAPYDGVSYYRLVQTGCRGELLSSRMVSVNYRTESKGLMVLPNTTSAEEYQDLMGTENREELVVLRNGQGEEQYAKVMVDQNDQVKLSSDNATKLSSGIYLIIATSRNKLYNQKITIR